VRTYESRTYCGYRFVRFLRAFLREIQEYLYPIARNEIDWKLESMLPEYQGLDLGTDTRPFT
jgi:hypothetical protein